MEYLLEEEREIIDAFLYELGVLGHTGYCSFEEEIDNGYLIHKDNNYWVVTLYKKEHDNEKEVVNTKNYTNIYNACLDILDKMKADSYFFEGKNIKIPRGTRVIITNSTDCPNDEVSIGIVYDSYLEKMENGNTERVYQVVDKDGRTITGLYGLKYYSDVCFRTMEDYIKDTERQRKENIESINSLIEANEDLYCLIEEVKVEIEKYIDERKPKK